MKETINPTCLRTQMKRINLRDKNFVNQDFSAKNGSSKSFAWDRSCSQPGPIVYTDAFLNDRIKVFAGEKIAWLIEPAVIYPHIYGWIKSNWRLFKAVWTHDEEIVNAIPNAYWVPMAGTWISEQDRRIHNKSKICSFIASSKNYAPGHKLRQEIRKMLPVSVDQYGAGYRPIRNKADGLNSYYFSIAVENCERDTYFTEKIIDCFNTGTIPIYWGTSRITDHFNGDGIIRFNGLSDLKYILEVLTEDMYHQRKEAIAENFERGKAFETGEEWIAKLFLK